MNRNTLFSGLALLAGFSAFVIAIAQSRMPDKKESTHHVHELQELIDKRIADATQTIRMELVEKLDSILIRLDLGNPNAQSILEDTDLSDLVQQAKRDPQVARLLRTGIESIILKEMGEELESVDWLDALSREKLQKLLAKTAQSTMSTGFGSFQTPVDVSDIEDIDGKVNRILEEFEGVNSYAHNNALVKQIAEMGDEAIEPLIARLNDKGFGQNWAMKMAITDSLKNLLTEEHEELILAEFKKNGSFPELIDKYQFPAAEDELMNKISYPLDGRVDKHVVDAAMKMNAERSYPLLIEYVSNGQNVSYAASQLAAEGVDIMVPLSMAATRVRHTWEKASLVELCLERDMPEGYDLAIEVLRSNESHAEHSKEKVYQYIRKYTGINGSYDEVADWLQEN